MVLSRGRETVTEQEMDKAGITLGERIDLTSQSDYRGNLDLKDRLKPLLRIIFRRFFRLN
jgi:hypothetical protein